MKKSKNFHPKNLHNNRYDFKELIKSHPDLSNFVIKNQYDNLSINFSDPDAVLSLNKSLLAHFYHIKNWLIPKGHLCPPIPGRADYIHYLGDLLAENNGGEVPKGNRIKGLDIGLGTGCIYPILGVRSYDWGFVGSDIDPKSIEASELIIRSNHSLKNKISCRLQISSKHIFENIIQNDDYFDFTMCNPPFHSSLEEALGESKRKVKNLNQNKIKKGHSELIKEKIQNFGGQKRELWCPGGEIAFIKLMIAESVDVKKKCGWFTTLVSKKENLNFFHQWLKEFNPKEVRTIEMHQGQKVAHILAWRFF